MRVRLWGPVLVGLALLAACGGAPTATSPSGARACTSAAAPALTPERERLLRDLIARANQRAR